MVGAKSDGTGFAGSTLKRVIFHDACNSLKSKPRFTWHKKKGILRKFLTGQNSKAVGKSHLERGWFAAEDQSFLVATT